MHRPIRRLLFGGYWNTKRRSLIDHVIATPGMKDQIEGVGLFRGSLAASASDHFPVWVKVRSDASSNGVPKTPAPAASTRQ